MHIGLTYDLRSDWLAQGYSLEETAEFDQIATIDALAEAIEVNGHSVDRIGGAKALVNRLAKGDRWDLVFNVAEGLKGIGREAQVPAILDVYGIPYTFADTLVAAVCLHKAWCRDVVSAAGVPVAPGVLVEHPLADGEMVKLNLPVLAKPVAEGTGKGVTPRSLVREAADLSSVVNEMLEKYAQPVLVEGYLPGREFTVGIVGTGANARVLGTMEILLLDSAEPGVYSYVNKEEWTSRVTYRFPKGEESLVGRAEAIALKAWRVLNCRDGGRVDLRCNAAGEPCFLEVNPLAGLHPEHSDLPMIARANAMAYNGLIGEILESALERTAERAGYAA